MHDIDLRHKEYVISLTTVELHTWHTGGA